MPKTSLADGEMGIFIGTINGISVCTVNKINFIQFTHNLQIYVTKKEKKYPLDLHFPPPITVRYNSKSEINIILCI